MSKKASLAELMGATASELGGSGRLTLKQLPAILGDAAPDLPKNAVGRFRLLRSLQQRFGPNWRSLPGVNDLVKEFDDVVATEVKIAKLKQLKYERSK